MSWEVEGSLLFSIVMSGTCVWERIIVQSHAIVTIYVFCINLFYFILSNCSKDGRWIWGVNCHYLFEYVAFIYYLLYQENHDNKCEIKRHLLFSPGGGVRLELAGGW
jgi:hypothetical protein